MVFQQWIILMCSMATLWIEDQTRLKLRCYYLLVYLCIQMKSILTEAITKIT